MIKKIIQYISYDIWFKKEHEYRSSKIRWAVRQFKVCLFTAQGFSEHSILIKSAALTFYTLMSIVPIAALVFAVVKGFGLADGLMQNLYSLFPHNREVVDYLITFADKALAAAQGGVVAFVGIVMLFWAVVRVICWGSTPSVRSTRCCRAPSRCWSSGRCSRSSMSWCPIRA